MSTSINVYGIRKQHENHNELMSIFDSCKKVGINPPKEVLDYVKDYDSHETCESGVLEKLSDDCLENVSEDGCVAYEVNVSKIPENISKIRFEYSY